MPEKLRTPLYEEHLRLAARMVPFAGWEMPLLYRGIIPEHLHTREKVSIFDICHMGEFEVSGPSAEADLEKLLTQSVAAIAEGACAYGYLLAEDGGTLDDLICYRFGGGKFWLVVNAATAAADAVWIKSRLSPTTVFSDLSAATAKLDIQGPGAREAVESALGRKLPDLEYFHFCAIEIAGAAGLLSRTGYTGEFGYELYFPADRAAAFWKKLIAPGVILPAGLGARDTLRVEMGFSLYGHELSRKTTPAGAARGRFIDLNKNFTGKEAVLRDLENPAAGKLVGLRLEGRMAARADDLILEDGREAGKVTSGLFSPSLNVAVALGYVRRPAAVIGRKLDIIARGRKLQAEIVKLPFYKEGTARR
ncbi:MAG: glycine cleavage system aminomethyltransferase GcvT [Kiritimatiellae bacterium]|nr:glycine cleavage system aminomethyltransferase GcvT [Kiritimatiellia bacterium]